ncbi:kinectin isoform X2 [Syngnathoides biaculeatus]|uniref:kinectin isoform X2 n=1 Tax=Syngnathoides biaculeatus TaxID=300417 RepID=UPI002ADDE54F|nr:kinectin isoform X2 [Syngnathoides biaculeatus]
MAVDIYDSPFLSILVPLLVVALLFIFFILFTKETSYDEVLARQKRDLKLPPAKLEARKKNEKKKSKKKESVSIAGGGADSEEDHRELEVVNGAHSSTVELVEEPKPVAAGAPIQPAPSKLVPVPGPTESSACLKERKKEKKKAAKAASAAATTASATSDAGATSPPPEEPAVNSSKMVGQKAQPPLVSSKQPRPPSPQLEVQVQVTQVAAVGQSPPQTSKKKKKQKLEAVNDQQPELIKVEQVPVKKEAPHVAETKVVSNSVPSAPSGKKGSKKQKIESVEESHVLTHSAASSNHQAAHNNNVPSKGKKQKNETDKDKVKLKELLSGLSLITLSDAEAARLIAVLQEKSPSAVDAWHKSATKSDPATQEQARLLTTLQEEASIAKDKVKQLSQELQVSKQKASRVEAMLREQCTAMEKELGGMQAKAQGSYQELQAMQMKFQQMREQMESQITRLQQENGILRDAVSTATNQMESKNTAEMNKLRSDYAALMIDLADNNAKLQQEEHQRKSLEVSYKQNVSQLEVQLQDAKRRWEELQNFLHSVNAEREKLQASKQELHSQMLTMESEMNNKKKELQTLHSSLTEAMVSKERLEQRVMELLELSQHSISEDSMQARTEELMSENKGLQAQKEKLQAQNENLHAQISTQANHISHIEELQKLLADKELQRKSLEDSLNAERSSGASRETNMQALHNDNISLKAEVQNLRAQISDQTASQLALDQIQRSVREKEENMKTVESLLEKGLIEVANKEEELKTVREENEALKQELVGLQGKLAEEVSSLSVVQELHSKIQERDLKLKSMEDNLQASQDSCLAKAKTVEALEQQFAALQVEMEQLRQKEPSEELTRLGTQLQVLQAQLAVKDHEIQHQMELREKLETAHQQSVNAVPSPEFLISLSKKENQVTELQSELCEVKESLEHLRKKNNELREKNWSAMEALSATESMLQGKLSKVVKDNQETLALSEAECRNFLHRLLPHVPLPNEHNHQEWLCRFERNVTESSAAQSSSPLGDPEELAEKLKEAEEAQRILQVDCETYKKVLAETEGILQRLQSSVEQEESRWKVKVELSEVELREMSQKVTTLEQEIERLSDGAELENLRREKQHLESELERAERESATYVTEVRELKDLLTELQTRLDGSYTEAIRQNEELNLLKTQLTETLSKLEAEENERQQVAGDLYKAQQSLDLIQGELSKVTDNADGLIENSSLSSQREELDRNEKMAAGLNQTVQDLQQLLQGVSRQLTKDAEADRDVLKV